MHYAYSCVILMMSRGIACGIPLPIKLLSVITEGEPQNKDDNTSKQTTIVHKDDESRKDDSSEAEPDQDEQEPKRVNDIEVQ